MLTTSSNVFRCTRAEAREVAQEWLALRQLVTSSRSEWLERDSSLLSHKDYDMWEDYATGGGGCRIVWKDGFAWISRHSGYPQADVTTEAREVFRFLGCDSVQNLRRNPHICG
jgi:hypothetical protein